MNVVPCMLVAFFAALPLGLVFAARRHLKDAFRAAAD